jgi:DNA adenine methylase
MKRAVLRYHGGKFRLSSWIISHFPNHRIYVEAFGGGGSILMKKRRCYAEIYNDLDSQIVNVFRVLRDPDKAEFLTRQIELTPFARSEFELSYEETDCEIEAARRTIIRSFMGFGSDGITKKMKTGFRSGSKKSYTTPAHDWRTYPEQIKLFVDRLRGVTVENKDYRQVLREHDSSQTLNYLDPPYVHSTRTRPAAHGYQFEMNDEQHIEMLEFVKTLEGKTIISGYESELYRDLLPGWDVKAKRALADGANERTEMIWISPNSISTLPLFEQIGRIA